MPSRAFLRLCCAALLSVSAIPTARGASAEEQFEDAYQRLQKADEFRDANQFSQAIEEYRGALDSYMRLSQRYPDWQPGIVRFRTAYCDNQLETILKTVDARSVQQAGLPSEPAGKNVPPAADKVREIRQTASLLMRTGGTEKARTLLIEGLRLEPDDPFLRLMAGIAQCEAGYYDDALLLLEELRGEGLADEALVLVALAAAYYGAGEEDHAVNALKRAIELNPTLSEAYYDLAQVHAAGDPPDLDAARQQYREALRLGAVPDRKLATQLQTP